MANNIDPELYPDNNSFVVGRPSKKDLDGSAVETDTPYTGLTDFECWLSTSPTHATKASAIHADLVLPLTEVASTGAYKGVLLGSAKRTHIASADGTTLYAHWQSVAAGYHEVTSTIWRTHRPGASS